MLGVATASYQSEIVELADDNLFFRVLWKVYHVHVLSWIPHWQYPDDLRQKRHTGNHEAKTISVIDSDFIVRMINEENLIV